jgi:YD repeat-containing protein
MKKLTTLTAFLACATIVLGQYTTSEIKKNKIARITKISVSQHGEATRQYDTYYDRYGNDTSSYMDGVLYKRILYDLNVKDKIVRRININGMGIEIEVALYEYKADGSYVIKNTDKQFKLTDYTYYDKTGKITKTISPDGAIRIYTYNVQGQLLSIKSKTGQDGVKTDLQYTYNTKGQQIKEVSNGEYKWTKTMEYNDKGLLVKASTVAVEDGEEFQTTDMYKYEFWN